MPDPMRRNPLKAYLIASIAALSGLLFGFDTAVINGALIFLREEFHLTEFQIELAAGSLLAGCVLGAASAGALSDRFGRKKTLLLVAVLFSLSTVAAALPRNLFELVAARGELFAQQPNILFILTDDHATHALSAYGSKINTTPNLDRLAREGMIFRACFVTNSICAPSRAVIVTGKHSHLNGVIDNRVEFDNSQQTFPKLLQRSGYQTAVIGKWHLQSEPTGF